MITNIQRELIAQELCRMRGADPWELVVIDKDFKKYQYEIEMIAANQVIYLA